MKDWEIGYFDRKNRRKIKLVHYKKRYYLSNVINKALVAQ